MSLEVAVADLAPLMLRRKMLLIGEPSGTTEFPALVLQVVNQVLEANIEVIVGLEIPMTDEVELGPVGPFWHRGAEFQDGRSSKAMANLVGELASLRENGSAVQTVAMDGPWVAPGAPLPDEHGELLGQPRDQLMATNLLAAVDQSPRAFVISMAGSIHTSTHAVAWRTFGSILLPWFPAMVSLLGQLTGGTRWVLAPDGSEGGIVDVPDLDLPAGALWGDEPGADGHHGYVNVGPVTASPPA